MINKSLIDTHAKSLIDTHATWLQRQYKPIRVLYRPDDSLPVSFNLDDFAKISLALYTSRVIPLWALPNYHMASAFPKDAP